MDSTSMYAFGCTKPPTRVTRLLMGTLVAMVTAIVVVLLETRVFRVGPRAARTTSLMLALVAGVFTFLKAKHIRGACRQRKLFDFYRKDMHAPADVAAMLTEDQATTNATYFFVLLTWIYVCIRS